MANTNLIAAQKAKNDEFYTMMEDIEKELVYYKKHFKGKTVYCNCDTEESNFVRYFVGRFEELGLKKLIATHWNDGGAPSYKAEWANGSDEPIRTALSGDGDFRSPECVELLKEADIVVTNPPFSLARGFISILYEYGKKFVIIGDLNWVAYKEVFPLFKDNRMFFGYTPVKQFITPNGTAAKFGNKVWFTNLDLDKAHEPRTLTKNYYGNEERYPKYENYDAIECGRVSDIPKDYFPCWHECPHAGHCRYAETEGKEDEYTEGFLFAECRKCSGIIGVPVTYLSTHCTSQFYILGITDRNNPYGLTTKIFTKDEIPNYSDCNRRGAIRTSDGAIKSTYARLLIRRKETKKANLHPQKVRLPYENHEPKE